MRSSDNMVSNTCNRIGNTRFTLLVSVAALGLGVGALGGCAAEGIDDDSDEVLVAEGDSVLSTADTDEPIQTPPLAPLSPSVLFRHCGGVNRVTWGVGDNRYTHFELQRRPAGGGTWTTFEIAYETSWLILVPATSEIRVRACNTFGCSAYAEAGGLAHYTNCFPP
jgi:hypothetical protein